MRADLVLFIRMVRTLDPELPIVSAVAIWGGRFTALGDDSLASSRDGGAPRFRGGMLVYMSRKRDRVCQRPSID